MTLRSRLDQVRRRIEERVDQTWALGRKRLAGPREVAPFDGDVRFALVTVNFSTTRFLKMMLLTLSEQSALTKLRSVVIVDNASRDGGATFARQLAARCARVLVAEQRLVLTHARGMRAGLRALEATERSVSDASRSNVALFCDTDVIFRRPDTLDALSKVFTSPRIAAAGELRRTLYPYPEAQASFLAVRRDCYARPDVAPWVNHGAPAYWLQRSLWKAGLEISDFPSNGGGYILHRGRAGVAAAATHYPRSSFASIDSTDPHFMGLPGGARIWAECEQRWAHLLDDDAALLEHVATRLT